MFLFIIFKLDVFTTVTTYWVVHCGVEYCVKFCKLFTLFVNICLNPR